MATKWTIDPTHSEVQFKVRHLVISNVTGYFRKFEGALVTESESFDGATANFNIDAQSIDTNVGDRDTHLRSDDFFAVDKFPQITFRDGKLTKVSGNEFRLRGPLTIRDITREVDMKVELGGTMVDGYGNTKAGFEVTGSINRKEFGLKWNQVTEAGGVVVGDEVKILMNIQLVRNT